MKPLILLICLTLMKCASVSPMVGKQLAEGTWGSEPSNMEMRVGGTSTDLEFGCAVAQIPTRILLDQNNQFSVEGTYTRQAGMIMKDQTFKAEPATFSGTVSNNKLKLNINVSGSISEFDLVLGQSVQIHKCQ